MQHIWQSMRVYKLSTVYYGMCFVSCLGVRPLRVETAGWEVGETVGVSEMEVVLYRKKSVVSEIYTECVHSATAYLLLFPSALIIFVHAQLLWSVNELA